MNQPLLSICIPTYNRAHYLKDCLNSIAIQLQDNDTLKELVEVIVSDNCSSDNTHEVVESYKAIIPQLHYSVNEKNLGFDLNVHSAVVHAHGNYCWYLGDDDVLVNGSIDFVTKKLKTHEYDILSVGSRAAPGTDYKNKKQYNDKDIFETTDGNIFFHDNHALGGFSTVIFNRTLWLECLNLDNYLEYWLYSEVPLKMFLKTTKKMANILQVLIYTGQDCRWSENGSELTTFINSNLLLERMLTFGFKREPILKILNKNRKQLPLILLRAKGHGLPISYKKLFFIYRTMHTIGFLRLFLVTILFFIPNQLVVFVRDIRKNTNKKS